MSKWIFVGFDTAYVKRWINGDSWVLMCVTGKIRDRSKWILVGFWWWCISLIYGDPLVEGFPLLWVKRHTLVFRLVKRGVNENVSNIGMSLTLFGFLFFHVDNLFPFPFLLEPLMSVFFLFFFGVGKSGTKVTAFLFLVAMSGEEVCMAWGHCILLHNQWLCHALVARSDIHTIHGQLGKVCWLHGVTNHFDLTPK